MTLRTYVGFGLGAIQSGLFLYEAFQSKGYQRLVIAEIMPDVVRSVRQNGGYLNVNIALSHAIQSSRIGPIEIFNPVDESDRQELINAISDAHEIGTAVPGTQFYCSPGPESLSRILAAGLQAKSRKHGPGVIIYTAENNNRAAEILEELVLTEIPGAEKQSICRLARFLNTVIGKMSGVIRDAGDIKALKLVPITPDSDRAFLVEAFNHILISQISPREGSEEFAFSRGMTTFIEKKDLLPFEEAKLFGHNATHALAAYLGALLGIQRIADFPSLPGAGEFLRQAFITESGAALIHRYNGIDPLFTPEGFTAYADDLLARMYNPWLNDKLERVARDVERKLGWDDRLVGTLRLGIAEGIVPRRFALGTAAALAFLDHSFLINKADPANCLLSIWKDKQRDSSEEEKVLVLIRDGMDGLRQWYSSRPGISQALFA
jgi:mannitol-1-phosphate/altronate dehydrogenase